MRRRSGADVVQIDTIEGFCKIWFLEPCVIDFDALEQASDDASYKLTGLTLEIEGEIVQVENGHELRIPATGQVFELTAPVQHVGRLHVYTTVTGWQTGRPRLTIFGHAQVSPGP